jgi:hypothetical protein
LILSKNPDLNVEQVATVLRSSTDIINSTVYAGVGRINAHKALEKSNPVIVNIDPSVDVSELKDSINIKGTVNGEGFQQYFVEYGIDTYPDSWIEICNSTVTVENGYLANWDSTGKNETHYTIRIRAIYNSGEYEDRTSFLVNNLKNTIYVDDDKNADYKHIQMAIDNAGTGDTVYVYNGSYYGDIVVSKSILLTGENKASTKIIGNYSAVRLIDCEGLVLSGFSISSENGVAITVESNHIIITDNIIDSSNMIDSPMLLLTPGIFILKSANTISYNTIINYNIGIWFINSGENNIHHNNFINNTIDITTLFSGNFSIREFLQGKYSNSYDHNYWDNWIGCNYRIFRFLPKAIPSSFFTSKFRLLKPNIPRNIHYYNFDRHPAKEPYPI